MYKKDHKFSSLLVLTGITAKWNLCQQPAGENLDNFVNLN